LAEWQVERGIGEDRALLLDGDIVLGAKVRWPDELHAGQAVQLRLVTKPSGARRGLAHDTAGREVLVDRLPATLTEGERFPAVITRGAVAERGRFKHAQARAGELATEAGDPFTVGREVPRFPPGAWEDGWLAAADGEIAFPGGTLVCSVTPAMTVIDIDGALPPRALAIAAVPAIARAVRQLDLGGAIAIDFPTLPDKADRKAVDAALEQALATWPHERTAMNGFGLVQLVTRLDGPSLLHRLTLDRAAACARWMLRQAEAVAEPGALLLTLHPAVRARLEPDWLDQLTRRAAREVRLAEDATLALTGGFAQAVPR
jgi:ribonuclease G